MLNPKDQHLLIELLKRGESAKDFLYQDSVGKVTIGTGNLLPTADSVTALSFINPDGSVATDQEKRDAYLSVWNAPGIRLNNRAYRAEFYATFSTIRMPKSEISRLLSLRISQFYSEAKKLFPYFDTYPQPARLALMDMIYNLGRTKLHRLFPRFNSAIRRRDWSTAAEHSRRGSIPEWRNIETKKLFLKAHIIERTSCRNPYAALL